VPCYRGKHVATNKNDLKTKKQAVELIRRITPYAITPIGRTKSKWIYPFVSNHAFMEVTNCIGNRLHELGIEVKDRKAFREMEEKYFKTK